MKKKLKKTFYEKKLQAFSKKKKTKKLQALYERKTP